MKMFDNDFKDLKESTRALNINLMSNITLAVYEYILEVGEDAVINEILRGDIENDSFRNCFPNIYRHIHEKSKTE